MQLPKLGQNLSGVAFMLFVLVVLRRPCGFDLIFLEQTVSLIADEDKDTQYLMQAREFHPG